MRTLGIDGTPGRTPACNHATTRTPSTNHKYRIRRDLRPICNFLLCVGLVCPQPPPWSLISCRSPYTSQETRVSLVKAS